LFACLIDFFEILFFKKSRTLKKKERKIKEKEREKLENKKTLKRFLKYFNIKNNNKTLYFFFEKCEFKRKLVSST
jgi:hypothetical protein